MAMAGIQCTAPFQSPSLQLRQGPPKGVLLLQASAVRSEQGNLGCFSGATHRLLAAGISSRMPQAGAMAHSSEPSALKSPWQGLRIGITGVRGALGQALCRQFLAQGAVVVGLSHGPRPQSEDPSSAPQEWTQWQCDQEDALDPVLRTLDVLVLNHGINPAGDQRSETLSKAITINALSSWRLLNRFEAIATTFPQEGRPRQLWVNTSEAEIQPALSPGYELSKRLIGQLVSLRWSNRSAEQRQRMQLRKLVLGPFKSELNPIGLMSADWVAQQVLLQARMNLSLIIVTPNPLTYLVMPMSELGRGIYNRLFNHPDP